MMSAKVHPFPKKSSKGDRQDFSALQHFDLPKIAQLSDNLYAACFSVIKILAARSILEDAVAHGLLKPGTHVVESTSGTFGIALAMLKSHYGYELTLISDPAVDPMLEARFHQMGVRLEIIRTPLDGSYQLARLARLHEILRDDQSAFFTNQYHNPANARGYIRLADYLSEQLGQVDTLVGTVGSGGSTSGTARRLRETNPNLEVVGVDTQRSVLFGQKDGLRPLRGLGNSLLPENLDHQQFDEVHWVSAAEAFLSARMLQSEHGLFMGATTGAAFLAARWHAARHPDQKVVFLGPDEGYRYLDTVYNDAYLQALPGANQPLPAAPIEVSSPLAEQQQWSRMHWGRRARIELPNS